MAFRTDTESVDVGEVCIVALTSNIVKSHVCGAGCTSVSVAGQAVVAESATLSIVVRIRAAYCACAVD